MRLAGAGPRKGRESTTTRLLKAKDSLFKYLNQICFYRHVITVIKYVISLAIFMTKRRYYAIFSWFKINKSIKLFKELPENVHRNQNLGVKTPDENDYN